MPSSALNTPFSLPLKDFKKTSLGKDYILSAPPGFKQQLTRSVQETKKRGGGEKGKTKERSAA